MFIASIFKLVFNVILLYLQSDQIRTKNEYRSGNWSAPLTVPLDNQCISVGMLFELYYCLINNYNNTDFTVTPTESSSQSLLIFN